MWLIKFYKFTSPDIDKLSGVINNINYMITQEANNFSIILGVNTCDNIDDLYKRNCTFSVLIV